MSAPMQDPPPVDVYLSNLDTQPADHQGNQGRVKDLNNGQSVHFTHASSFNAARLELEPRKGFSSLSQNVRDLSGVPIVSPDWSGGEVLDSLGDSLVSIAKHVPRVWNGYDAWTEYVGTKVVTNKLREDSLVGGYGVAYTPDQCTIGHVQMVTWTLHPSDDTWEIWAAVREVPGTNQARNRRGDDLRGPWIVPPFRIGSSPEPTVAHVRTDGTWFFVIWNKDEISVVFNVYVYDTFGRAKDNASFPKLDTIEKPGWWDVTLDPRIDPDTGLGLVHAQPAGDTGPSVNVNVRFTRITYDGISIGIAGSTDTSIDCNGWCGWLENRLDNLLYLVTSGTGGAADLVLRAWQINNLAQTDSWDIADIATPIDAITGYVSDEVPFKFYTEVGLLEVASTTGPQYNPQARKIVTYGVTDIGGGVVRTSHEQALVSKTFNLDGDEICATFYQSGSGINSGAGAITPDTMDGDYFSGSSKQTVKVSPGGGFAGPNQTFVVPTAAVAPFPINTTQDSAGPQTIASPDKVEYLLAPAGLPWLAEGTPCLKWTIAACVSGTNIFGGRLKILATGYSPANFTWDIYGPGGSGVYYTTTTNTNGGSLAGLTAPVTLTTGTAECISMTQYYVPDLGTKYDTTTVDLLVAGNVIISGNPVTNNNGTKVVQRAFIGDAAAPYFMRVPCVWVTTNTGAPETTDANGFTLVTDLSNPNVWGFGTGNIFAIPQIGGSLIIENDVQFPENNNPTGYEITAVNLAQLTTDAGDTGTTRSQTFVDPVPKVTIALPASIPAFTFFIQDLAADLAVNAFRFKGATLQLASVGDNPQEGLYRIIDVGPALDGTLYCERVVQTEDLPARNLRPDIDFVTIFLPVATQAPFQPTYFLTPAIGTRATVGMFDRLNAFNNWRENGVNTMNGHLTHVDTLTAGGYTFVAPTTQQRVTEVNSDAQQLQLSTVGIKAWTIRPEYGVPLNSMVPGTQAVDFEGDSWPEDGFALAPEAPWLLSVGETDPGTVGLQTGGTYVITLVWESQDSRGQRVSSPPSPPLVVGPLAGTNNKITLGLTLPFPLDSLGAILPNQYGITNRLPLVLSVYTTSYRNGLTTQTQYKVTDDLRPNALAPISTTNESGFAFDGSVVSTYVDANQDLLIQSNEPLYSVTALPRFGAPAWTDGEHWNDRDWILDSAGNTWFSTPVTEGQRPTWFPGWKLSPPNGDRPIVIRAMQQFLIAVGEKSSYYLPVTALPSAALVDIGQTTIPSWVQIPNTNGCTGHALTTPAGVFYASTAGGIWSDTRGLANDFVSQPLVDQFAAMNDAGRKVQGMAIDRDQRMIVANGTDPFVYDFISGLWSVWQLPDDVSQVCTHAGRFVARMGEFIVKQTDFALDNIDGANSGVDWSFTGAGLSFGGTRAFQRLRRLQVIGNYKGPHNMQVTFAYPDDFPNDPTVCPVLRPDGSLPYLIEAMPGHGRSSQFEVTVAITHDAETGYGESCTVELFSCKIGVQQGGQRQVTPGQRV